MPKRTQSVGSKILVGAGYQAKAVPGIHEVTVSDTFRGKRPWIERLEVGLLELTGDPELVAEIKAASIEARRKYLIDEMVDLVEVAG